MKAKTILAVLLLAAGYVNAVVQRPLIVPRYSGAEIGEWTMDHDTALAKAREGTNHVVVLFSGSWWCPHCQALERSVLTNQAWQTYVESNKFFLVTYDNPGRADQYWCWLRDTNYVESAGLSLEQGEAEITNHYVHQTAYATPGAPTNTVKGISYLRVGYPTLIVLRPDGSPMGRFTPLASTVSLEMVLRNMEQILAADPGDEADNFWEGATPLATPLAEFEEVDVGVRSLSESDPADWYLFDASTCDQWSFAIRGTQTVGTNEIKVQIFSDPSCPTGVAERVLVPSDVSVLSYAVPRSGRYWLKVSRVTNLTALRDYHLSYWHGEPSAIVNFQSQRVTVSEGDSAVRLTVNITGAALEDEIRVSYETIAGSALPGLDYEPQTGEICWPAGEKWPKTITIPLLSDSVLESDEWFNVVLYAVKRCEVDQRLSSCEVVLTEPAAKSVGRLTFQGTNQVVLLEGSNAVFGVSRVLGAVGAVTARVEHVQGSLRVPVATLVWTNMMMGPQTFSFVFTNEVGYQVDRVSVLRLVPLGGVFLNSVAGGSISLTRRDKLVVQPLKEYAACPENKAFSFASAIGGWFYGYCSDDERGQAWLRSGQTTMNKTAILSSTVRGPGIMGFDWRLDGASSLLQAKVGRVVVDTIATPDICAGATLAIPSGIQTVSWVLNGAGVAAVRAFSWCPLPQTHPLSPANKSAVINRALTFSWQDVLVALNLPVGVETHYEVYAGISPWGLEKFSEQTATAFPRLGEPADQNKLDTLIARAAPSRPLYWRVDTVATDTLGRRVVYAGDISSVTVLPEGSPEYVASADGYDPMVMGGVVLPAMKVGVYEEMGPFSVDNTLGGTLAVSVKNGALPYGVRASVRDGAVWITGTPKKAGQGLADLHLAATRVVGGKNVTVPGTSVTVRWVVEELGRAAGQFDGYLEVAGNVGLGSAACVVSSSGAISARFFRNGQTFAVSAPSFAGRAAGVCFLSAIARSSRQDLPVELAVAENGEYAMLQIDGEPDHVYSLRRNNWADPEGAVRLRSYAGYYTIALPVLSKSSDNAPGGTGYLTVTVKNNGAVTYAGQVADGRTVSGSTVLLYGSDCCSLSDRVTFYICAKPSGYTQSSGLYGLVYLASDEQDGNAARTTAEAGDPLGLKWIDENPQSMFICPLATGALPDGVPGFTNVVDATGGFYDKNVNLLAYYGEAELKISSVFHAPEDFDGQQGTSGFGLLAVPDAAQLPARITTAASPVFPSPMLVRNGNAVDLETSVNPWQMGIKFTRSTGVFKGAFLIYYQGLNNSGIVEQKIKSVSVKGAFLPSQAAHLAYPDWMGFYLVPDRCHYLDPARNEASYLFNWSHDFLLSYVRDGAD